MIKNLARWLKYVLFFNLKGLLLFFFPSKNEKKIKKLRNCSKKERCFIVATGPSLKVHDIEQLEEEVTFGLNGIFLLYGKTKWRPTYYVCTDNSYFAKMKNNYKFDVLDFSKQNIFLNNKNRNIVKLDDRIAFLRFSCWNRAVDFRWTKFNAEIDKGMYAFGTVTNIAIAIAMYMGFKKIYLLGCDCSNLNKHVINDISDEKKSDEKAAEIAEIQIKGYKNMKKIADIRGVNIYNATRGGALEVFDRVTFDDLF